MITNQEKGRKSGNLIEKFYRELDRREKRIKEINHRFTKKGHLTKWVLNALQSFALLRLTGPILIEEK